jgi:hypothetical protein
MGMRVGSSSANWASSQTSASVSGWQQRQQGMKDLFSSLQSGDLASAQKAFASVQTNTSASTNSPLTKVGTALQAGDLAGAQQAAKAMHAARGGGHHHAKAAAQASDSTSSSTTGTTAEASSTDTAFNSFIQNLEAALEQQGQTTTGANGQGSFLLNMPPPPANLATASPSTQDFLSSRGAPPSNAQLEASLESLIQQMSGTAASSSTSTDATTAAASSTSAASNLQSSFANLIGAMGGQSSTASVTSFLQNLDNSLKSMDAAGGVVNTSA